MAGDRSRRLLLALLLFLLRGVPAVATAPGSRAGRGWPAAAPLSMSLQTPSVEAQCMLTEVTPSAGVVSCEASHPVPSQWHDKSCQVLEGTLLTWQSQDMDYCSAIGDPQLLCHETSPSWLAHNLFDLLLSTGCDSVYYCHRGTSDPATIALHQLLTQPCPPSTIQAASRSTH